MKLKLAILLGLLVLCSGAAAHAHGAEADAVREHTVYQGQRLGSIAKRYNVSIAAVCHANGIQRRDPIQPGQHLIIPSRSDKDGSKARQLRVSGAWSAAGGKSREAIEEQAPTVQPKFGKPKTHVVYKGQRLGSIAKRYNVSVDAICLANGISARTPIRPKQKLLIPHRRDKSGGDALAWRLQQGGSAVGNSRRRTPSNASWAGYVKKPWRRGYVKLIGHTEEWKGYVFGPKNELLGGARRAVSRVLTAPKNRKQVNSRLVRLMAQVSDTFGGRPLRIISGYRTTSFVKGSRHKSGRAVDFRIPGVPNEVLRDYLRTFENVGVGYYPNSTFVHFDVRKRTAYWVDYAGPGEAPKLRAPEEE